MLLIGEWTMADKGERTPADGLVGAHDPTVGPGELLAVLALGEGEAGEPQPRS